VLAVARSARSAAQPLTPDMAAMSRFSPFGLDQAPVTFNFTKAHVLAIDESTTAVNVLCQILSGFGFRHFSRCTDIAKATPVIYAQTIDLILIDPYSFGESAYEWVRWLRNERLGANAMAPVMVITGQARLDEVRAARDCGADYVVAKPYSPTVLLERILWVAQREGRGGFMAEHKESVSSEGSGVELW
jgi:DNA-binding response OmpR family regulator